MKQTLILVTFLVLTNLAMAHTYNCKAIDGDEVGAIRKLSVTAKTLKVKSEDDSTWSTWAGKIDKTYNPHAANKNYVRFEGSYTTGGAEYTPWYLIENTLLDGETRGYMKEQARGEGYFATKYACRLNE